jgi:hypothetical protein
MEEPNEAFARTDDPTTSRAAARRVKVTRQQKVIVELHHAQPDTLYGLTTAEMEELTGISRDKAFGPRIKRMVEKGLLERPGGKHVRNGSLITYLPGHVPDEPRLDEPNPRKFVSSQPQFAPKRAESGATTAGNAP